MQKAGFLTTRLILVKVVNYKDADHSAQKCLILLFFAYMYHGETDLSHEEAILIVIARKLITSRCAMHKYLQIIM